MSKIICKNCGEENNNINQNCLKCGAVPANDDKTLNDVKDEMKLFTGISRLKVFLLSFFSFGIYDYFWFYKQWSSVRRVNSNVLHPFLCSVFKIISIFFLSVIVKKSSVSKSVNVLIVPILYIAGHSFIFWIFCRYVNSEVLILVLFMLQKLVRALALSVMQQNINDTLSVQRSEKRVEVSDGICFLLAIIYILISLTSGIPESYFQKRSDLRSMRNVSNFSEYQFPAGFKAKLPFAIARKTDNENKNDEIKNIVSFSGSAQNGSIYVLYKYTEYKSALLVNWDVFVSEKAAASNVKPEDVTVSYAIYGNKTGRIMKFVSPDNVYVTYLVIFDSYKNWEFVVSCLNDKDFIKMSDSIIESVTIE